MAPEPTAPQGPDDDPKAPPARRQAQHQQPAPPLVRPSIFQYSCRGALYLDDRRTDSASTSKGGPLRSSSNNDPPSGSLPPPHSLRGTPRCVGIESRLRKLSDLPPSSRDAAVRDFVSMTSVEPAGGGYGHDGNDGGKKKGGGGKSDHGNGRRGGVSGVSGEATSGSNGPLGPAPALPVLPGAADYGPPPDADGPPPPPGRRMSGGVQILPPRADGEITRGQEDDNNNNNNNNNENGKEQHDHDETWSSLSCYGVTHVSVLMLKGTGRDGTSTEEVAAVAPENTFGVTVRDEGDRTGGDAVATLRIGPIEVAVGNHYEFEDERQQQRERKGGQLQDDDDEEEEEKGGDFGRELGGWGRPPTAIGDDDRGRRRNDGEEGRERPNSIEPAKAKRGEPEPSDRRRRRSRPDEGPPQQQPDESSSSSSFAERFAKTLGKTAESMKSNANHLAGEMNDDLFPSRVYKSGERIVGQFGKTMERTGRVAKDIYKMWSNDDDDEGD